MSGHMRLEVWQEPCAEYWDPQEKQGVVLPVVGGEMNGYHRLGMAESKWCAWYNAPGYMDHTSIVYADSAEEAARECFAAYGMDERGSEDRKELAETLWALRHQRITARNAAM